MAASRGCVSVTMSRNICKRLCCKPGVPSRVFRRWKSNVTVEQLGAVSLIAINRPDKRNAVDWDTAEELLGAVEKFDANPESKVAVLYGKGGTFCAGFDLSQVASLDPASFTLPEGRGTMGPTRMTTEKPVIAAIEGYAVAGGLEIALWCDLRVMADTAVLGVFCRRFGVPLIDGGTVRLPRLIGLSRALDLILTGREIHAKEALEMGLVNRVCETGTAVGRALLLAQEIAKFPKECMKADRASAYYSAYGAASVKDALDNELEKGSRVLLSESVPGARKFVDGVGRHGSFNLTKNQLSPNGSGEV